MPCFDPKDVIFVTNKWDTIYSDSDDDEENEVEINRTWRTLKSTLMNEWPDVQEENIFKISLSKVTNTNVHIYVYIYM